MNGTVGSLFSGCGGLDLGLHYAGLEVAWACENDAPARSVFQRHWPTVAVAEDVREVDAGFPHVDVLAGGFPCQDISQAGLRAGLAVGTRSGLWFAMADAIRVLRPQVVIVENVPRLLIAGFGIVAADLAALGYLGRWCSFRASDLGAPHGRERVFIVATDASGTGRREVAAGAPPNEEGFAGWSSYQDHLAGGSGSSGLSAARHAAPANANGRRREQRDSGERRLPVAGAGGEQAPTDSGGDRLLRLEEIDGSDGGLDLQPWDELDGCTVGDGGSNNGHAGEGTPDWGVYAGAVEAWEELTRPAPRPTDDRGRLSPAFVEWMLGYPDGWTEGVSRTQRLKMLGNSVQVQVAELVGLAVGQLL